MGAAGTADASAAGLGELADRLRASADVLAERMLAAYRAEIPQYAQVVDPLLLADMKSVSLAGLHCWLDWLTLDRPLDGAFLAPVLEPIRRRAVQGVGMDAMMRAYRIAARVVWQEILELPPDQSLVGPLSTRMLEFTDKLTTEAEHAYAVEALRAEREPEAAPSALFEAILSDQDHGQHHHADRLAAPHCVVVADVPPGGLAASLEDVAAALVRAARAAYWTTRHRSVVAACPVDPADAAGRDTLIRALTRLAAEARPGVGFGVGGIAQGAEEIRDSFREALDALRVGSADPRNAARAAAPAEGTARGAVYDFEDLAPLVALVADPGRARRFARDFLRPLGQLTERAWVLPTLESYLRRQGRLKEVAADLAVHPNTVRYRLNELRPFLDAHAADGDRAAAALLAVHASAYLAEEPASG